jgi:hypothetical protein
MTYRTVRSLPAFLVLTCSLAAGVAGAVTFEGAPVTINTWLLIGPFPAGAAGALGDAQHLQAFDTDYLNGEASVQPAAGQQVTFDGEERTWKLAEAIDGYVDLDAAISRESEILAYGFTDITSAARTPAVLGLGTNDGARVWLNGEQVWDYPEARGYTPNEDYVPIMLEAGINRLLIKVEERGNQWGFGAQLLPLEAASVPSNLQVFNVSMTPEGATLNYLLAPSLVGTVIHDAVLTVHSDTQSLQPIWRGNWIGAKTMPIPIDASRYGTYVLEAKINLAGGISRAVVFPFVAGKRETHSLFADGGTEYEIVVGPAAPDSERWAAEELQQWLKSISGIEFPIVSDAAAAGDTAIILGFTPRTAELLGEDATEPAPDDESFTIKSVGPTILIWGGAQRGTMYGVHTFLEREFGCRWYTKDVSVIPKRDAWSFVSLDHREGPGVRVRNDFYYEAFDSTWAARNKMNGAMTVREQPGGVEGYWAVHTFFPLMPPEEFFEVHPEYYSLIDGERVYERAQLCLTHPDVLRIITERLLQRMRESPEYLIYSVSQNDWRNPCQCENCQAIAKREESESGPIIWFVNQVAEAAEAEFPDKFVGTLAYQYTRKPPKTLKPRENVVIRLCSIECCFAHDFTSCPRNAEFMDDLRGWAAIAPHMYIWDYVVNFSHYVMPYPNFRVLQPNIKTFRDHKAIGIMEQAAYQSRGGEFAELRAYVIAQLLWNPECDVPSVIDDFIYGYYGRSGQYIRAYFDLLHSQITPETHIGLGMRPDDKIYSDAFIREAERLFDKAEDVADDVDILHRVELARLPLMYLKCKRGPQHAVKDGTWGRFKTIAERENVTHLAEAGAPHKEAFYAEMEAAAAMVE